MSKYFHEVVLEIGYRLSLTTFAVWKLFASFVPSNQNSLAWHLHSIINLTPLLIKLNFPLSLVQAFHFIWPVSLLSLSTLYSLCSLTAFWNLLDPLLSLSYLFLNASCIAVQFFFQNDCFVFPLRLSIGIGYLFTYLFFLLLKSESGFKQNYIHI